MDGTEGDYPLTPSECESEPEQTRYFLRLLPNDPEEYLSKEEEDEEKDVSETEEEKKEEEIDVSEAEEEKGEEKDVRVVKHRLEQ